MKRLTLILAAVMTAVFLTSCSSGRVVYERPEDKLPITGKSWTVLIYMCGGSDETQSGTASDKLSELMSVEYPANVTAAVQTGGSERWHTRGVYSDYSQRFEAGSGTMYLADQAVAADMGDYHTLSDFLTWGTSNYKADKYMLILSGTGGGGVNGMLSDELYENSSLSLEEISYAMSLCGRKFDIVGLDASLMGGLETAASLSTFADYLVSPQTCQRADSWDYGEILSYISANPSAEADEVGRIMCDTYYNNCVKNGDEKDAAMSVTDMSKISALTQAFDGMAGDMLVSTDLLSGCAAMSDAIRGVRIYGGGTVDEGYSNLIDLGDLALKIREYVGNTAEMLINALNDAVVYRVCGERLKNSSGMNVYYPLQADNDELQEYMEIAVSNKYKEFLRKICIDCSVEDSADTEDFRSSWAWETYRRDMESLEYKTILNDNSYELNITGNMGMFSDISVNIYKENKKSGEYVFVGKYGGIDSEWDAGIFKFGGGAKLPRLLGKNATVRHVRNCGDYDIYSIPVLLGGERAYLRVMKDENGYEIMGAWRGLDENGQVRAPLRSVGFFDRIIPVLAVYDSEHKKTEYRTGSVGVKFLGGISDKNLGDGKYIFEYEMTDIYGVKRRGTPVEGTASGGKIQFR